MTARNMSWRGDAVAVAQVDTITVGGTFTATDTVILTVGNKSLTVVVGSTVNATIATNIATAWNGLSSSAATEFAEITAAATSGGAFTLTADVAGKPFTVTTAIGVSSSGTISSPSVTVVSAGPNDLSTTANYNDLTTPAYPATSLPITGDTLTFENNGNSAWYGLTALSGVTLAGLHVNQSFTGQIGLPQMNAGGYMEYRPRYMQLAGGTWDVGLGNGSGSGKIQLDFGGSANYAGTVFNSGSSTEKNIPAILVLGSYTANVLSVFKGSVGVAVFAGEVADVLTLNMAYVNSVQGDAIVQCGNGAVVSTVNQAGGQLTLAYNVTTITQYAGTVTIIGATAISGTATIGGTLIDQSSGNIVTVTLLPKGVYDHSKSLKTKTITNLNMNAGAVYSDPYGIVTISNRMAPVGCSLSSLVITLPLGHTVGW